MKTQQLTIVVNGREVEIDDRDVTFEEVVALAFPSQQNSDFTVTYRRGRGNQPSKSLRPGAAVKVSEGVIFNVTATTKS